MSMEHSTNIKTENIYKLFAFSFFLAILTYGFALTNFTISIDNEMPILSDFGLDLGRWGQNLILYHLFGGHLQYFSLILSLFLFSLAAVQISNLLKFTGFYAYCFCGLFISFPQLSYQLVFGMMAVVSALGVLLSVFSLDLFLKAYEEKHLPKKIVLFSVVALILMFTMTMYQAFVFIPVSLFLILFFQKTFENEFKIQLEIKKTLVFSTVVLISGLLYYISVKIICPLPKNGYVESFVSGGGFGDFIQNFIDMTRIHLSGNFYYGEKLYSLVPILVLILSVSFFLNKKHFIYRFLVLILLMISPITLSYFITSGYHPPRIYLTSNLIFAFILVFAISHFKVDTFKKSTFKIISASLVLIVILNIFFVTKLFLSANEIYKHDKRIAEKIDNIIQEKYPSFNMTEKSIYFYGYFPFEYHQKFRLDNSEIFGGSFYNWNNGNNYRIINFFREAEVAEYSMITKEKFDVVKDSIEKMPTWPDSESIKMINNTMIVKLGKDKGEALYFE
ncbi:MAG: glucosyltransferase domain-containing protein [Bacteroidota bacterium]